MNVESSPTSPTPAQFIADAVRRHRAGDPGALTDLYRHAAPVLLRVARGYRLPADVAEDVVQAAMESALSHLPDLRDPGCGLGWLMIITRREALRACREQQRCRPLEDGDDLPGEAGDDPEEIALDRMAHEVLLRALARLPERQRRLLCALFLEPPRDYTTIAASLAIPVGSIGPTRRRGLAKVRGLLTADREWVGAA
jgi:RNA polymerase sigma factor (sigma-70 family)